MRQPCAPWSACFASCIDDRLANEHAGLDRHGPYRHEEGLRRSVGDGADGAGGQPFCGHVFVFRGRRGDMLKALWFDGQGLLLLAKRLERGRFIWPQAQGGKVSLTPAQLSMLLEGIDWRMPMRTDQPALAA
jgi:transposase